MDRTGSSLIARSLSVTIYTCSQCEMGTTDVDLIKNHRIQNGHEKAKIFCQIIKFETDEFYDHKNEDESSQNFSHDLLNNNVPCENFHIIKDLLKNNNSSISNKYRSQSVIGEENTKTEQSDFIRRYSAKQEASNNGSVSCERSIINKKSNSEYPNNDMVKRPRYDWSKLIARVEKKFICLLCRKNLYNGRTEVVFHAVTRHLLKTEITKDLQCFGRLSARVKSTIGHLFVDGMRIRSGVHYKDAERVEVALFQSIELHLRYRNELEPNAKIPKPQLLESYLSNDSLTLDSIHQVVLNPNLPSRKFFICSACNAKLPDSHLATAHINEELRKSLPEFMKARSCPWSLSSREEWVWLVPDYEVLTNVHEQNENNRLNKLFFNIGELPCHLDIEACDESSLNRSDSLTKLELVNFHKPSNNPSMSTSNSEKRTFDEAFPSSQSTNPGVYQNFLQLISTQQSSKSPQNLMHQNNYLDLQQNNSTQSATQGTSQNLLSVLLNAFASMANGQQNSHLDLSGYQQNFDVENIQI